MIKVIAAVLIIIAVIFAGAVIGFFCFSLVRPKERKGRIHVYEDHWNPYLSKVNDGKKWLDEQKQNMEKWEIKSYDGLNLVGHFLPAENHHEGKRKVMLMMHGYHSSYKADFCISSRIFHDMGYDLLLIDQRSHGESEGKLICYGVKERFDCLSWLNEINRRLNGQCDLYMMGVSMGCATVTMALGLELPKNLKVCISDCGYTSPTDIFAHVMRSSYRLPKFPLLYTQNLMCRIAAGFDPKFSTIDILKKNKLPVLFIHGDADDFVPTYMSRENYQACASEKELLIIPGAHHAQCFAAATETCTDAIVDFIEKHSAQ